MDMETSKINQFEQLLNILIIEDTAVDQHMLQSMLKESNYPTRLLKVASSLKESLALIAENEFDVILLDLNLTDSEGIKTLSDLSQKHPEIPIVVNTGAYENDLGIQTLRQGAQDFLVKGKYNADMLNKVLRFAVERKKLEAELKEAYQKLKSTQSQLIQVEKLKVVGSLASGVAHEVRNPLATINYGITYLQNNCKLGQDAKVDSVMENMKQASDRANEIITDLLDFASLNRLKKSTENLKDLLNKAMGLVVHQVDKKKITIDQNFAADFPEIVIDRNRIEQVFVNVLLNAISSMDQDGVLVIKAYVADQIKLNKRLYKSDAIDPKADQKMLVIEFKDNGKGVKQEHINSIFDPFFTTCRDTGGVGLGLSVCKNIMESHHGEILIVNNEGEAGATALLIFKFQDGGMQ